MGTGEEPLRRRFCRGAGCGLVFWICRHCDRGHQYCGERCRRKARRRQRRAANRRHQQSREGRLDHRDRQRAYRERHSLRRVTDHTSPAAYGSGSIGVAELSRSENGPESFRGEARYADCPEFEPVCNLPAKSPRREYWKRLAARCQSPCRQDRAETCRSRKRWHPVLSGRSLNSPRSSFAKEASPVPGLPSCEW